MLGRRLFSAAILITLMVSLLYFDFWLGDVEWCQRSGLLLAVLCLIAATAAADELSNLWRSADPHPSWLMMAGAALMMALCNFPLLYKDYPADCPIGKLGWVLFGIAGAVLLTFAWEMFRFDADQAAESEDSPVANRIARSSLAFVYIAMLFGFVLPHRQIQDDNHLGVAAIVLIITTVKLSDAVAYFAGKSLGSRKLAPALSPKKTVEGGIGALIGGVVGAAFAVWVAAPFIVGVTVPKPWWWVVLYGVVVTMAGMIGDLAESLLKRDAKTKDSSSWLPGLGGVLDVIDSLVFAAPVSYVLWLVG